MTAFLLNGAPRVLAEAAPGRTVLDYLRLEERLTGTKEGCAEGDCGACTVAIGRRDGAGLRFEAVNACIMLASDLEGCALLTVEGLGQDGALAPAQTAMVEGHGSQCGFCTPGFVMSLFAFGQNPQPEEPAARREAILDALAGNLCRCTGYRPIVAAAEMLGHAPDARVPEWRAALDALQPEDEWPHDLAALDALLAARPGARLVCGATDIGVPIAKHGRVPGGMVPVRQVAELDVVEEREGELFVGASASYSAILPVLTRHFPGFAALVRRIGSLQIRNLGSMGGNVCNASPIGDSAPCLIALGAVLVIRSAAGERELAVEDFFEDYRRTALRPGEYLRAIRIPYLRVGESFAAYKLAKRFDQDISAVAAAFKLRVEDGVIVHARAGFGGMAATPMRAAAVEAALLGKNCVAATFEAAAEAAGTCFAPLSDFRASAAHRREIAAGFVRRLGAEQAGHVADVWAL